MTAGPLQFRDVARGQALQDRLHRLLDRAGRPITVMHVCGSHEQAMARYGLRDRLPSTLHVQMGPGCPVCVTDATDIDAVIALAEAGVTVLTYGDMFAVPGTDGSLQAAQAAGARVDVIYAATQAVDAARASADPVVFFATGFETTAVATAAILLNDPPPNLFVYSAHKWVPAAMDIVARLPHSPVEGFLAAGHAATITGFGLFEPFVATHQRPVVVAGFEPLDILAALVCLVECIVDGNVAVVNAFARCVSRAGNARALSALHRVFDMGDGPWRGIAHIPGGELTLRPAFQAHDARSRFADLLAQAPARPSRTLADACVCGSVLTGVQKPSDCMLYGKACQPQSPIGACMVSSEGPCRIWFDSGRAIPPTEHAS